MYELSLMRYMSAPADLLPDKLVLLLRERSPPLLYNYVDISHTY